MTPLVTDVSVTVLQVRSLEGETWVTNVTYQRGGRSASARLPWVATAEQARTWLQGIQRVPLPRQLRG